MKKIFCADLFCGGGGTSTGMINAFRRAGIRDKDIHLIGVNHWNLAIETNKLNHPFEKLYCSTVENVKPREAVPSGHLNFLWASPECTNHSLAKGMGFPPDYKFVGKKNEQVRQIGNAVSPNLSEALIYSALSA